MGCKQELQLKIEQLWSMLGTFKLEPKHIVAELHMQWHFHHPRNSCEHRYNKGVKIILFGDSYTLFSHEIKLARPRTVHRLEDEEFSKLCCTEIRRDVVWFSQVDCSRWIFRERERQTSFSMRKTPGNEGKAVSAAELETLRPWLMYFWGDSFLHSGNSQKSGCLAKNTTWNNIV